MSAACVHQNEFTLINTIFVVNTKTVKLDQCPAFKITLKLKKSDIEKSGRVNIGFDCLKEHRNLCNLNFMCYPSFH